MKKPSAYTMRTQGPETPRGQQTPWFLPGRLHSLSEVNEWMWKKLQFFWLWVPRVSLLWMMYLVMPFQCNLSTVLALVSSSSSLYSALKEWYVQKNLKGRKSAYLLILSHKRILPVMCGRFYFPLCFPLKSVKNYYMKPSSFQHLVGLFLHII